jgi:hypothetical protein
MSQAKRSLNVRGRLSTLEFATRAKGFELASLEARLLMCADGDEVLGAHLPDNLGTYPVITQQATVKAATTTGTASTVAAGASLSSVPALDSRPGAYAKLYLDFNGDTTPTWGNYAPGTTPAYDTDGDPTTFSDAELASIHQIFDRVAEKYSPFNIDVTTVDPGNLNNKQSAKVVIGGDGAWLGSQAGGVAYVGGFTNSASNVVFVFPKNLGNGYAQYVGEAAAHESGHGFGLQHQSSYDATGTKTSEYAPANTAGDAPVMGNSYTARRGLWWLGTPSNSATTLQDDMSVISGSTNGFGYRADDFGNSLAAASTLTLNGTTLSGAGVVEKTSDSDVFSFTAGAGALTLSVTPTTAGGMLDARINLTDDSGTVLASSDNGLAESLSTTVAQGTYYLTVSSHGGYGDVGEYTISGTETAPTTVTPQPTVPMAPSSLAAQATSTSAVHLTWTDNSSDETGFKIYSSRDGSNWTLLGTVGANVTGVDNTGLRKNQTYYYKVLAYNAVGDSSESNVASAKTSYTARTALKGDLNLDGVVDFNDLVILSQHYNTSVATATGGNADVAWQQGDMNDDGVVDFNDLVTLSQNYNAAPAADTGSDTGTLTPVGGAVASSSLVTTLSTAARSAAAAGRRLPFSITRVARQARLAGHA